MAIFVTSTTDKLQLVTSASADIEWHVAYVDLNTSTGVITPNRPAAASIVTNTTTDIVAAPGANLVRNVKGASFRNNSSTTCDVTVQHTDGTNTNTIIKCTLILGESLVLDENGTWSHYDANGGLYLTPGAAASQAEMEAGTSTTVFVTPGRQHYHPSAAKFWVNFTGNSTTILASYNMTSISDGTTEATLTIATDFSSANWCCLATGEGTTSSAVANARLATTRSIAAGSIIVFAVDGSATTVIADPTRWHVAGFGDQ